MFILIKERIILYHRNFYVKIIHSPRPKTVSSWNVKKSFNLLLLGSNAFNEENHYELKIIAGFYDNTEKHDMSRLEKIPKSSLSCHSNCGLQWKLINYSMFNVILQNTKTNSFLEKVYISFFLAGNLVVVRAELSSGLTLYNWLDFLH